MTFGHRDSKKMAESLLCLSAKDAQTASTLISAKVIKSFNSKIDSISSNTLTQLVSIPIGSFNTAVIYIEAAYAYHTSGVLQYYRTDGLFIVPNMNYTRFFCNTIFSNSISGSLQSAFSLETTTDTVNINFKYTTSMNNVQVSGLIAVLS